MCEMPYSGITSGFLIVRRPETMGDALKDRGSPPAGFYGIRGMANDSFDAGRRYRGIDRSPIFADDKFDDLACVRMAELEKIQRSYDDFIFDPLDAKDVLNYATAPVDYEIIWCRIVGSNASAPPGFKSLGFEATYFDSSHFSPSCDCMFFPRCHGTDSDGTAFALYFAMLNANGLFETPGEAQAFLDCYLSFDWTERGDYCVAEIFSHDT